MWQVPSTLAWDSVYRYRRLNCLFDVRFRLSIGRTFHVLQLPSYSGCPRGPCAPFQNSHQSTESLSSPNCRYPLTCRLSKALDLQSGFDKYIWYIYDGWTQVRREIRPRIKLHIGLTAKLGAAILPVSLQRAWRNSESPANNRRIIVHREIESDRPAIKMESLYKPRTLE